MHYNWLIYNTLIKVDLVIWSLGKLMIDLGKQKKHSLESHGFIKKKGSFGKFKLLHRYWKVTNYHTTYRIMVKIVKLFYAYNSKK